MTPQAFLSTFLVPGLQWTQQILGDVPRNVPEARLLLLAAAGHETRWQNEQQENHGAGMGPYQLQENLIDDLEENPASQEMFRKLMAAAELDLNAQDVWSHLLAHPYMSTALARLMMYCDPNALPTYGDIGGAWQAYVRIWRPGNRHFETWSDLYKQAWEVDKAYRVSMHV